MFGVSTRKTVLISEPQFMEMGVPSLPIMWGVLKTYWEHHGTGRDHIHWLAPIHYMGNVGALLRPYWGMPVDVLGLSCYAWNWDLQCEIARAVKAAQPQCLVVAGGPEPDYKDRNFFQMHPYIDMIAVKDGEITFTNILNKLLSLDGPWQSRNKSTLFADIPGLYLPGTDGNGHLMTGPAIVPQVFDVSPYIAQHEYYKQLRDSLPGSVVAIWETNRGCPYKCSFCDWGSNTMSKLRKFDIERIKAEIEWFGQMNVSFIFSADANFGILKRDLEITDLLAETNKTYGFPTYFRYSTAKNHPDRTVAIAKKLYESGMTSAHHLSIQHTDEEVLAATERSNISVKKQIEVVRQMMQDNIPIYVQLILGIPGDTWQKWKQCFYDLMEWGVHAYYWVFPYNLLPNAPAAEPEYMQNWKIETLPRYVLHNEGGRIPVPIDEVRETRSRLIVETKSYTRRDWVRMHVFAACIKALHNGSVTQSIAVYLRFTHNVSYAEFYDDLYENWLTSSPPMADAASRLLHHYERYLNDGNVIDFLEVPELPSLQHHMEPSRWMFVQFFLRFHAFFDSLEQHLVDRFPQITNLSSVIAYQKNLMILPDYNSEDGKTFQTDHDWVAYFARARALVTYEPLPEPESTPGATVHAGDKECSDGEFSHTINWKGSDEERLMQWIQSTVFGRNSVDKNNFQELSITTENNAVPV